MVPRPFVLVPSREDSALDRVWQRTAPLGVRYGY